MTTTITFGWMWTHTTRLSIWVRFHLTRCCTDLRNSQFKKTVRFQATGRYLECLKFTAIMSPTSIRYLVLEMCEEIIKVFLKYMEVGIEIKSL